MDLSQALRESDRKLFDDLQAIKRFSFEIWKDRLLPWFTNHNTEHSEEIIFLLGQLLEPLKATDQFLNTHELFVLLASSYLHDIGMQYLKIEDISVDRLTEKEHVQIRKRHAQESYNIVLKIVGSSLDMDDFHPPSIDEQYVPVIALVCRGHSSDYFDEVIEDFRDNPRTPQGRPFRGELLTALLLIGDELDLQCKRVNFKELAKYELSPYSRLHWFKHHYVDFVGIVGGSVKIRLRYPPNPDKYETLIKGLIESRLVEQIKKVNPVFRETTSGTLQLNETIVFDLKEETTGAKRPMSPVVLEQLSGAQSKTPSHGGLSLSSAPPPPKATKLFTGREDKLTEFAEALKYASFISIEGVGGVGKTEFGLKCAEEFFSAEKVVWFDSLPDSKLDSLIEISGFSDLLKGENRTDLAKYSGFTDLIERNRKAIFIDNFQDMADPSFHGFLGFCEKRLAEAKIILITREHPNLVKPVPAVELTGLGKDSVEYAGKFAHIYYKTVSVSDSNLSEICEALDGHPLAIELAIQLLSYGESSHGILQKLADPQRGNQELSGRLLNEVFDHPKSTEEERSLLLHFSVFRNEVERDAFPYLLGDEDSDATLHRLIDKKMIVTASGLYGTHPLIREFCYPRLLNKTETHRKAASYLPRNGNRNSALSWKRKSFTT